MQTVYSDHSRLDERSLAMHRLIATKVQADPALLDKARENLRHWREMEGSPKLALVEWEQILGEPISRVAQFLTERSERATRLRQSSPFAGLLTEAERKAIYESYSARTYHPRREPNRG
jgi:hypothetical protein